MNTYPVYHLPLTRRVGLVRAFAALVGAQAPTASPRGHAVVPDYLRHDLGLPPVVTKPASTAPPTPRWLAL